MNGIDLGIGPLTEGRGGASSRRARAAEGARWRGLVIALLVGLAGYLSSGPARADAVDDAFARGSEAAQAGDWDAAIEAYEEASALLPERSAVLSYDLGTAYLHRGDLGLATYHLRRALDWRGGPTAELVEATRQNLAVARRRAELQATNTGAKLDRETWWDVVIEALRAPGVGWSALVAGWIVLGLLAWRSRRRRRGASTGTVLGAVLIVLTSVYLGLGVLHGLALRADRTAPEAVVVRDLVDARDGAGNHRAVQFRLQGGALVRVVDRNPGWLRVRLPGGLEGWVPEDAVGTLRDQVSGSGPGRTGPRAVRPEAEAEAEAKPEAAPQDGSAARE